MRVSVSWPASPLSLKLMDRLKSLQQVDNISICSVINNSFHALSLTSEQAQDSPGYIERSAELGFITPCSAPIRWALVSSVEERDG